MSGRLLHAVALPTGPALLARLRSALDAGPAVLPIDPDLPAPALRRLLADMRPHTLVRPDGVEHLDGAQAVADDVALVIATSGSTGVVKGVELSASAVRHSAAAALHRLNATPEGRWLCCLPTCHIGGVGVLVRSLVAGTDPVFVHRFSVEAFAAAQRAAGPLLQHTALVPTMLQRLLDAGIDLTGFRSILVGGAALPGALLKRARDAGATIVATYGASETAGGCVYDGIPLDGVRVDVDADARIRISGEVLANGYRLRPDLTRSAFVDGWLLTPDLGRLARDGRLAVLGRADDVIITGGVKVAAGAVAELLATHPDVGQVAVVGRADGHWGHRVVAVVVPRDPATPPTLQQLRAHVTANAAGALAPKELVLVAALPLLPSGKVNRQALSASGP